MKRQIKSHEDQLKAVLGKTKAKGTKGDRMMKSPQSILKNKGTPAVSTKSAPKRSAPKKSARSQDTNNNDSAYTKGKKKKQTRRFLFNGKKAATPTNLHK